MENNINYMPVECLQIPKILFRDPKYKKMTVDAKVLYALLLDRMNVATFNGWIDEQGERFVIYPKSEMKKDLNATRYRVDMALKELCKKEEMIVVTQPFPGRPCQIYVKDITANSEMEDKTMSMMKNMKKDMEQVSMKEIGKMTLEDVAALLAGTMTCFCCGRHDETEDVSDNDEEITPFNVSFEEGEYFQLNKEGHKIQNMRNKGYLDEDGIPDADQIADDAVEYGYLLGTAIKDVLLCDETAINAVEKYVDYLDHLFSKKRFKKLKAVLESMALLFELDEKHIDNMKCCMGYPESFFLGNVLFGMTSALGETDEEDE